LKLEIQSLWSPDPDPGALTSFRIPVQVAIAEQGRPGHEVFSFTVSSFDQLAVTEHGSFVAHLLVLRRFSWHEVRTRIQKLLRHTESSQSWPDAIRVLAGYLRHNDSA